MADNPCTEDYRADLHEGAGVVRAEIWTRNGATTDRDYDCLAVAYVRTVTSRLTQPLGERAVILDPEGVSLAVADTARIAIPGWLPIGRSDPRPTPRNGGWEHIIGAVNTPGDCGPDDGLLVLYQRPPSLLDRRDATGDRALSTHPVRGTQAEYFDDVFGAQLRWIENGQGLILSSDRPCDNTEPLPLSVILKIFRNLTVPPT